MKLHGVDVHEEVRGVTAPRHDVPRRAHAHGMGLQAESLGCGHVGPAPGAQARDPVSAPLVAIGGDSVAVEPALVTTRCAR